METSEIASEHENEEAVGDAMDNVEDEQPQREDPAKIKAERLANNTTSRGALEDAHSTM